MAVDLEAAERGVEDWAMEEESAAVGSAVAGSAAVVLEATGTAAEGEVEGRAGGMGAVVTGLVAGTAEAAMVEVAMEAVTVTAEREVERAAAGMEEGRAAAGGWWRRWRWWRWRRR